ncbi:MAG: ABC transporter permease [Oscillospiraceae bacterium]|nr:ABC transporter permease [Oscillospiraceae bacterium]
MKTYFYLQCKRVLRFLPFVAAISVVLFLGLAIILNKAVFLDSTSEEKQLFKIGIVGNPEDTYLNLGMAAVETFDSSRFTIKFEQLTEENAQNALRRGTISAYVVIPDGFIESAMHGNLQPLNYITTTGTSELSTIFKDELTSVISSVLSEAQKGVYGLRNTMREYEQAGSSKHMNDFSIEYFDFILGRDGIYKVTEMGVSDNITLPQHLICGISVLLLLLLGLPYAPIFVKKDFSLNKKLLTQGYKCHSQVICEYLSYFIANLLLVLLILLTIYFSGTFSNNATTQFIPSFSQLILISLRIIPVIFVLTSLTFLIFELSGNLVNGILLYFFSTLALCYVSGCLYPVYTFPQIIQDISAFLPTGIARSYLAGFVAKTSSLNILWLILYSIAFLTVTILLRRHKTMGRCDG